MTIANRNFVCSRRGYEHEDLSARNRRRPEPKVCRRDAGDARTAGYVGCGGRRRTQGGMRREDCTKFNAACPAYKEYESNFVMDDIETVLCH